MIYTIFIQQLLFSIIALLLTYVIGKLIVSIFIIEGNFFLRLFLTYFIGITSIVLIYSIVKAHGRTVNILLIPIMGYMLYYFRFSFTKKLTIEWKTIAHELLWSLIPFVFIYFYQSWFYFDIGRGDFKPLFTDFAWYAGFTNPLSLWGTENLLLDMNYYFPVIRDVFSPYHYPELWLTSFLNTTLNQGLLNSYYFETYPLLVTIFALGVCTLLENNIKNRYLLLLIALLSGFITDFTFLNNFNTSNSLGLYAINGQKAAFIYCAFITAFIALRNKHTIVGYIILASIPILSIIYAPGIWGGLLVFILINIIFNKKTFLKTATIVLLIILFTIALFIVYSTFITSSFQSDDFSLVFNSGIFKGFDGSITFANIKRIVANFSHYALPNIALHSSTRIILYIPFFLLLYKSALKEKSLLLLLFVILIAGATASTIFKLLLNSDQFTSLLGVLFIVFIIFLYSKSLESEISEKRKIMITLTIGFLSCLSWISPYNTRSLHSNNEDMSFIRSIATQIPKEKTSVIMVFYSDSETKRTSLYSWIYANDMTNLMQFTSNHLIYTLANPEIYIQQNKKLSHNDSSTFYKKMPIQVWRQKPLGDTSLQGFISKYNITYFYIKQNALVPDFILKNAKTVLISQKTGSSFIISN